MALFDALLKQLVGDFALDFAAWLLDSEIESVEPLALELPAEQLAVDSLFRVSLPNDRLSLLHIEFQGRRSHRPMAARMLDYLVRIMHEYELPIRSIVLYIEPGAGRHDTGQYQHQGPDGEVVLAWNYRVIHLWRMRAEDILAIGRRSLLPLVGLTRFKNPAETVPKVVAEIGNDPDEEQQSRLFGQLIGLLKDEEITAMIQEILPDLDLNELREFPNLWKAHLKMQEKALTEGRAEGKAEGKAEGERTRARDDILEVIATRFNPPVSDYRHVETVLETIDDTERLDALFKLSLTAADFAEFEAGLSE